MIIDSRCGGGGGGVGEHGGMPTADGKSGEGRPQPTQSILALSLSLGEDPANRSAHIKGSRKHSFIRPFGGDRDRGHGQPRSLGPDHRVK